MSFAIKAQGLSKKYIISHQKQGRYETLRDTLTYKAANALQWLKHPLSVHKSNVTLEEFWALKDIDFDIKPGDRVGIIGRNGAGKSTLLKILSRITEPTTGKVQIKGRVSSLLEVGTGFHPELTGRENIYLNGSILGMSRKEIRAKFDEIIDFAEIEKFLDTPVKRYSSGMYVRLAFAIAAHLEPEILIVDEVLAVGDLRFQKKCLGKMKDAGREGKTVLFVSHNMGAICQLCQKGMLLEFGRLLYSGDAAATVSKYFEVMHNGDFSVENSGRRGGLGGVTFTKVWVSGIKNEEVPYFSQNDKLNINMEVKVDPRYRGKDGFEFGIAIDDNIGNRLYTYLSSWADKTFAIKGERLAVKCTMPSVPLIAGKYLISVVVNHNHEVLDVVEHCGSFEVIPSDNSYARGRQSDHGHLSLPCDFSFISDDGISIREVI